MGGHTRRQLLVAAAAATGGLAGCLDAAGGGESSSHSSRERPGRTIPEQSTTDPAVLYRRSTAGQPPIRLADNDEETNNDADDVDSQTADSQRRWDDNYPGTKLIDDAATADRLVVNSSADVGDSSSEDRTDLRTFLSATDFERETLYLETRQVRQCFQLSLCYIAWNDGIQTGYGRVLRPYDEACTADKWVTEARLFRLPVAIDTDTVNSFGSSTSSSRCRRSRAYEAQHTPSTESGQPATNGSAPPNGSDES